MPNTGYNSNLMLYDRILDKFYLFSISNNFQDGYGTYTDDEDGLVKKFFYLQKEPNDRGITIYRIHSYRIWENNEWVVQKNIGHTKYDSFNITLQTTEEDLYITENCIGLIMHFKHDHKGKVPPDLKNDVVVFRPFEPGEGVLLLCRPGHADKGEKYILLDRIQPYQVKREVDTR